MAGFRMEGFVTRACACSILVSQPFDRRASTELLRSGRHTTLECSMLCLDIDCQLTRLRLPDGVVDAVSASALRKIAAKTSQSAPRTEPISSADLVGRVCTKFGLSSQRSFLGPSAYGSR